MHASPPRCFKAKRSAFVCTVSYYLKRTKTQDWIAAGCLVRSDPRTCGFVGTNVMLRLAWHSGVFSENKCAMYYDALVTQAGLVWRCCGSVVGQEGGLPDISRIHTYEKHFSYLTVSPNQSSPSLCSVCLTCQTNVPSSRSMFLSHIAGLFPSHPICIQTQAHQNPHAKQKPFHTSHLT
jgi:hypothetical protein